VRTDQLFASLRAAVPDPGPGVFGEEDLTGLPEPVARWFRASIAPGTPHATAAELDMVGSIRLGRWVPMRARELVAPTVGFVWAARVGGIISGADHNLRGKGGMTWRLAGLVPVVRAEGPDVGRSSAGRAAAEGIWIPSALLPRHGVGWEAPAEHHLVATWTLGAVPVELHLHLDPATGLTRTAVFDRWGDPERSGTWGGHPFGVEVVAHHRIGPYTVAAEGRAGWYPGDPRWATPAGEFFRYRMTTLRAVRA